MVLPFGRSVLFKYSICMKIKSSISYDEIDVHVVSCIKERAQYLRSVSDQFIVRTIHAYCRRILSQFPLEGQIHPKFQVTQMERKFVIVSFVSC